MSSQEKLIQLVALVSVVGMTLFGLYLQNRGDTIPQAIQLGVMAGIGFLLWTTYNNLNAPKEEEDTVDVAEFHREADRKAARKANKAQKIADAKTAKVELQLAQAEAKAAAKRVAAAEAKARKAQEAAKKVAAAKKEAEKVAPAAATVAGGKKKKKKKKSKAEDASTVAAAAAAAEVAAIADILDEDVSPVVDEWSTKVNKLTLRNQRKAAERKERGIVDADTAVPAATEYMNVDRKHFKTIIGQGSKNITQLQNLFDCKIQLPNKGDSTDLVVLTGNPAQIQGVKEAITQLCDKGYCKALSGDVSDVQMSVTNVALLIGPGGSNVSTIQTKTGVKINLPSREERTSDQKETVITLLGDLSSIQNAMTAITELMTNGFCSLTHPDWVRQQIGFPGSMLGILLGPKGSNIKAIEKETNTTIKVPNAKTEEEKARLLMITITGELENVNKARSRIAAIQTDFVRKELDFPANLLASLIGNKGANVQRMQQSCNVRINIQEHLWDPTMRAVTVEGFSKDANSALAEIATIIATHSRAEVEFPASRIGNLIGKKGETINKIKDSTSTRITVTTHDWDETVKVVQIDGLTENVKSAVEQIEVLKIPPPKKERKPVTEEGDAAAPEGDGKKKRERRPRKEKANSDTPAEPAITDA